jgi:hypothetical protein
MDETGDQEPRGPGVSPGSTPKKPKDAAHNGQQEFTNPTINIIHSLSRSTSTSALSSVSREDTPPPLPPRPRNLGLPDSRPATAHSTAPARPQLVSKATTQLSYTDTQTYSKVSGDDSPSSSSSKPRNVTGWNTSKVSSETDDAASLRSYAPTEQTAGDSGSVLDEGVTEHEKTLWRSLGHRFEDQESESIFPVDPEFEAAFETEFDDIEDTKADGSNEG